MSDRNLINRYETSSGQHDVFTRAGSPMESPDWDDTLKITSHCRDYTFVADEIYGGKEDCVDIHNGANGIVVVAGKWVPQGKYLATIKGGVRGVQLSGEVHAHGKEVDVDIGNRSTTNNGKTTGVRLDLTSKTGRPITIRVLHGDKPVLEPNTGPYKFIFPHPDAWYHGIVVWFFRLWK